MSNTLPHLRSDHQPAARVAIIGHRGIPNSYGGFETLAEELAKCLVNLGCTITVYCRAQYFKEKIPQYAGAALVYLTTIRSKHFDTFYHTLRSVWHIVIKNTADVIIIVNVGNVFAGMLARLWGKKVILCVDGLDWERKKWGKIAQSFLKSCSYLVGWAADEVVTDAASVHAFYKRERGVKSTHIPYGTEIEAAVSNDAILKEYNLTAKRYFIYVARFEPENNPLLVVKAHAASGSTLPLVMVGDNRYNHAFVEQIKAAAGKHVIFTGYVFGNRYKALVKSALASVRAAEAGGLSPVVIEAMGRAVCMLANDKPENREPLGNTGIFFNLNLADLANHFKDLTNNPELAIELGKKAAQRAMLLYSWDTIAYGFFRLIKKVLHKNSGVWTTAGRTPVRADYNRKRILITGAAGVLGSELYRYFKNDFTVCATTVKPREAWQVALDVTDQAAVERIIATFKPDYIFHTAALTSLEACEQNLTLAYAVNTQSTKQLAQLSSRYGAKFIFVSTANIFNGEQKIYNEHDEAQPINVYGLTKHMGELMTAYYAQDYLIIRLAWLVGGGVPLDQKFVAKIVEQLLAGRRELQVVSDKFGTISYAPDVARTLRYLLEKNSTGVYHIAAPGIVSRVKIAEKIISTLGYGDRVRVIPVKSGFFTHTFTTIRPAHECLAGNRLKQEGVEVLHTWEEAIEEYLHDHFQYAYRQKPNHSVRLQPAPAKG